MIFDQKLLRLLSDELMLLDQSQQVLEYDMNQCLTYQISIDMSDAEKSQFDSLGVRFVRSYEVFSKQVVRTILRLLGEEQITFVDTMNKAEQLGLISDVSALQDFRKLRNQLVHAYIPSKWPAIYQHLMDSIPMILQDFDRTRRFCVMTFNISR